ncbi:GTP-binding elongation factor tu family protein,putative [Leishmania mexicana MHOM/GT/2001/U1103]|uniref:GTP-binding protein n=1 Tax=Leishmania mexicana (strain MHOM/GT/2001/U1103) TaxID=929439 RepID=E9B4B9_LEIMU|nr:GTP-binding elongation factor tu family protein,putative [Leishmania mexicana MHOM/GT/2001/U1103]CBZ30087.1 GTP-binding elongation factor tu family protein,putative [Leishmania mexicana MHOM/GT/2001/U1103]
MAAGEAHALCIVLYEPQAEKPFAEWVASDAVRQGLKDEIDEVITAAIPQEAGDSVGVASADTASPTQNIPMALIASTLAAQQEVNDRRRTSGAEQQQPLLLCLVVIVFWDGQAEASKAALAQLKQLGDKKWVASHVPLWVEHVEVLVQALNAKRGAASIMNNKVALVASLRKKLQASAMATKGWWREGALQRVGRYADPNATAETLSTASPGASSNGGGDSSSPAALGEADISVDAVRLAVDNGQGETFFLLSDRDRAGLASKVETLKQNCEVAELGCASVMMEPRELHLLHGATGAPGAPMSSNAGGNRTTAGAPSPPTAASSSPTTTLVAQEFLLRRRCPPAALFELRLAMCGNVDSGKSTLTSVLTRGCCDDGRGLARAFVFKHKQEVMTGRTSSISENHLGFSAEGGVVNYALLQPHRTEAELRPLAPSEVAQHLMASAATASGATHSPAGGSGAHTMRQCTTKELAARSSKVVTLYDLAGHERYLKTTVLGMTRNMPDYACIVISANNGIQRMTKEHLALCLALKLPFFIVVTRIDATPSNIHDETLSNIHRLLKIPTVRKLPYPVRRHDEVTLAAKNLRHDRITPIFEVSNVTGVGIPDVLQFLNLLPTRKDWRQARSMPKEMIIDSTFFVTGVGTVVGGIITQGVFRVNETVLLGPDGFGNFRPVVIKSIHIKGVDSLAAEAGTDAALCLKKEKRSAIRKGNVLVDAAHSPKSFWQFEAEIIILYHSTTITANYEPVIHSTTVRQSARITYVAQEVLRTGDKSLARFHFLYRPEYMKEGQRLIFREGRTKGIGIVTKLICEPNDLVLAKNKLRKKMQEKLHAPVGAK